MERVEAKPAVELAWEDLDREWNEFWTALAAHAQNPAQWFTPERAGQLQQLLARGAEWRRTARHAREEQDLYACHLRRLQPVLHNLQGALAEAADELLRQRQHLRSARDWAGSQPGPRLVRRQVR